MILNGITYAIAVLFTVTGVIQWRKGEKASAVIDFCFTAMLTALATWGVMGGGA